MSIYTDLACEARELDPRLPGITENRGTEGEISLTRIAVTN